MYDTSARRWVARAGTGKFMTQFGLRSHVDLARFELAGERALANPSSGWARSATTFGVGDDVEAWVPSTDAYIRDPDPIVAFFAERDPDERRQAAVSTAHSVLGVYEIYRILEFGTRGSGDQSYESAIDLLARSGMTVCKALADRSFLQCVGSLPRWEQKFDILVSAIARANDVALSSKVDAIDLLLSAVRSTRIVLSAAIDAYREIGERSSRARPFARARIEGFRGAAAAVDETLTPDIEEALADLS